MQQKTRRSRVFCVYLRTSMQETFDPPTPQPEVSEQVSAPIDEGDPRLEAYITRVQALQESLRKCEGQEAVELQQTYKQGLEELVTAQANFPGDWTLLLLRRALDPITFEKYQAIVAQYADLLEATPPGVLTKDGVRADYHQRQMDEYTARIAEVFIQTGIGTAQEQGLVPYALGVGRLGSPGTVFDDAVSLGGQPLTRRQKNIIEAHEKVHGLWKMEDAPFGHALRAIFDPVELAKNERVTYLKKPDEILARMSQIRDYFGLSASDMFTSEHLAYARTHYCADTGLDNHMRMFFDCVTQKTQDTFIACMNTYPM